VKGVARSATWQVARGSVEAKESGRPPSRAERTRGRSSSGLALARSVASRLRRYAPLPPSDLTRAGRTTWRQQASWQRLRGPQAGGPGSGSRVGDGVRWCKRADAHVVFGHVGDALVGDAHVVFGHVVFAHVGDALVGDAQVGDAQVGDAQVGDAQVGDAQRLKPRATGSGLSPSRPAPAPCVANTA